jgi:DNA-binding NarL/FixJ family response regulator
MAKQRKTGLPKALEEEPSTPTDPTDGMSPEEFAREFFGVADKPQNGLPALDWLKEQFKTKSAVIRYLVSEGHAIKDIAKHLDMRYQHVRNVATSTLKRGPNEDWRPKPKQTQT